MDPALLACIFAPLSLVERLRLATVSKQWLRGLLADLRFPREHAWRASPIVRRAGDALRSLHVAPLHDVNDRERTLAGIVRALCGGAGAQLRSFVMWDPPQDATRLEESAAFLSAPQALQLGAACPHLDASTRLALSAEAAKAVAVLDAVPGRHAVSLVESDESDEADDDESHRAAEGAAQEAVVRHPRLFALILTCSYSTEPYCFGAALAALGEAMRLGEPSTALEHLYVNDDGSGDTSYFDESETRRLSNDGEVAAAATASDRRSCLKSLSVIRTPPLYRTTHKVVGAGHTALQHLSIVVTDTPCGGMMSELLEPSSKAMETLALLIESYNYGDWPETGFVHDIATFIASADCRLRTLILQGISLPELATKPNRRTLQRPDPHATELHRLAAALAGNRSLTAFELWYFEWDDEDLAQIAAALAARALPLRRLRVMSEGKYIFSPYGVQRVVFYPVAKRDQSRCVLCSLSGCTSVLCSYEPRALASHTLPPPSPTCAAISLFLGCGLPELSLSPCELSEESLLALGASLATNTTLTSLEVVCGQPTSARACSAVLDALCGNSTLQSFRWCAHFAVWCSCIDGLNGIAVYSLFAFHRPQSWSCCDY